MAFDFISTEKFTAVESFALANPPTWTRLEPQSTLGDPRPGIEARVHDPLWLLGRQWQLGEFEGDDAGTPLTVRVVTRTVAVDRWAPAGTNAGRAFSRERQELLEPLVEREPAAGRGPGLRGRAEAAAVLLAAFDDAGLGSQRAAIVEHCPLDFEPLDHPDGAHADLDPQWLRLVRLLRGRGMADGETICRAFEDAGGLPPWLIPADAGAHAALLAEITAWAAWYRAEVSTPIGGDDSWVGERLEYRFRAGSAVDRVGVRLVAPWLFGWLMLVLVAAGLSAWGSFTKLGNTADSGLPWRRAAVVGLLQWGGYFLVLVAFSIAPLAVVAPVRESAIVAVALWGVFKLREREGAALKVVGAALTFAGIVLLAI